jgi:3,4-dihydroxy 2-butanone 4-phosphate synthase/GTP cyclohydrolase II
MARLPELRIIADELQLKLVSIESLVAYRMKFDSLVEKVEDYPIETKYGTFQLQAFKQSTNQQIHIALTRGNWSENDKVLTRIQSLNMTQNIIQSLQGNTGNEFDNIFKQLVVNKHSCVLFINKIDSIKSYELLNEIKPNSNDNSTPTMDEKDFGIGAQILQQLNIQKLSLLSNSDQIKRVGLAGYGLEIVEYVGY